MRLPLLFLILTLGVAEASAAIHYPLSISSDGSAIRDASGQPVVFNAATPWHIFARLTREDALDYLDARASQGFNALLVSLIVTDGYDTGSVLNAYGEPPFLAPGDFSQPNEAYFSHIDWVLRQAADRGFTMFVCPVYLGYDCGTEGWCAEVQQAGAAVMRDFGRFVGARYRDQPNIVWVEGGDVDAGLYGVMDETDALVEGILEQDPDHLHTAHCSRYNSASDCYDRPWLDFDTTYADCQQTPAEIQEDVQRLPDRATVFIEGRYEFSSGSSEVCVRSQAYWSALGGAKGHFFGSHRIWDFPSNWRDGLYTEGTTSMEVFGALLGARHWETLVPDYAHTVVTSGYGDVSTEDYAAAAQTGDRNSVLVYLPSARTVRVDMSKIAGTTAEAWWIDPSTGRGNLAGTYSTASHRSFTPPSGGQDWLLVIDNTSAPLTDVWENGTPAPPLVGSARGVEIESAVPNPFNPRTTIRFHAPAGQRVKVAAYDSRGRQVSVLFDGTATGATQDVVWRAEEVASGLYFVRAESAGVVSVEKVGLLK